MAIGAAGHECYTSELELELPINVSWCRDLQLTAFKNTRVKKNATQKHSLTSHFRRCRMLAASVTLRYDPDIRIYFFLPVVSASKRFGLIHFVCLHTESCNRPVVNPVVSGLVFKP